jgi:hypothetical protein
MKAKILLVTIGILFTRHTWEMLQSLGGQGYTQIMNMTGNMDRVDYFGGATFATNENVSTRKGVSLGNYININIHDEITEILTIMF